VHVYVPTYSGEAMQQLACYFLFRLTICVADILQQQYPRIKLLLNYMPAL
jgi:hypothetical protein